MVINELDWIKEAKKHVGKHEVKDVSFIREMNKYLNAPSYITTKTAWCGTFVSYCLNQFNIKTPTHWYRALDYITMGTKLSKPAYGCVAIKTRKGGGHVCFVVGRTKDNKLVCLGGNQSDMVCYALYNESDFEEFRWYGRTPNPAAIRYALPLINGVSKTKVTES